MSEITDDANGGDESNDDVKVFGSGFEAFQFIDENAQVRVPGRTIYDVTEIAGSRDGTVFVECENKFGGELEITYRPRAKHSEKLFARDGSDNTYRQHEIEAVYEVSAGEGR